ncbi:MAG: hypothetical protein R2853_15910 [Thermomicrobiales bacterium]
MDSTHFDGIARDLAGSATRRQALRTLAAAGLGLGLARTGLKRTEAARRKGKGKKKGVTERCKKSEQCGGGLSCKPANSQNSCFAATEKRCCKPVGAKCDDGCECCGVDVICNGGYCDQA